MGTNSRGDAGSLGNEIQTYVQDQVATLIIDRPHARNAISLDTMKLMEEALNRIEKSDARVLVLRGAGDRAFVSGGDLKELSAITDENGAIAMAQTMRRLLDRVALFPLPVIAGINGHALGGGAEVAVAADIRIMADDASIGFTQTKLGIMPAWGGAERLVELVGPAQAMALMITARRLDPEEALRLQLVEYVIPRAKFDSELKALAGQFAALPEGVTRSIKAAVSACRPRVHGNLEREAVRSFARLWVSDDHWRMVDEHMRQLGR